MLHWHDHDQEDSFLRSSTIKQLLWSPQSFDEKKTSKHLLTKSIDQREKIYYGLGWFLCIQEEQDGTKKLKYAYHTGGAVGASSCLLIKPNENSENGGGTVVAIICNTQDLSEISKLANELANIFSK